MTEIIARNYQYIYLILLTILLNPVIKSYKAQNGTIEQKYPANIIRDCLLVLCLVLFIGLRPSSRIFVDMGAYIRLLRMYEGLPFYFNWETDNIIFDNLIMWWASVPLGHSMFFLLCSFVYFFCAYVGIKRLFPTHTFPAYLVFLTAFSTFSYATNGIKAGMACSIFIMALGFLDKKLLCLFLALVSMGFHHSMQLPVVALIITMFFKNPKWYYWGWLICFFMALFHITFFQNLFAGITDEHGAEYLLATENNTDAHIGFRPDFVLYSVAPVCVGYYYEMKRKQTSKIYSSLMHFYLCTNGIWMLCMYASFNNRIAYLSWFVYPIVLIYPFLYVDKSPKRYKSFSKAISYHLLFTLFMAFIYYGLFSLGR